MVKVSDMLGKEMLPATQAGTIIDIQKDSGVKVAACGIEWDRSVGGPDIDVDVWLGLLGSNGMVNKVTDFVYYKNHTSTNGCAYTTEDNRTGADVANKPDGYDELAVVTFDEVPADIEAIVVGVSIDHSAASVQGQTFKDAKNARAIVYDYESKKVLAKCDMSKEMVQYDAILLGKYKKTPNGFVFESMMKGFTTGIMGAVQTIGLN